MSPVGTFETCRGDLTTSVHWRRLEAAGGRQTGAFDPISSERPALPASSGRVLNCQSVPIGCGVLLLLGGFAGVSLGSGRTHRARGSCGPRRTSRSGRSDRSGKATIFYHHFSLILPGGNLDDAGGGELRSNPTKPSSRTALDLHCFAWADFNMHAVLARSPNPSDDC